MIREKRLANRFKANYPADAQMDAWHRIRSAILHVTQVFAAMVEGVPRLAVPPKKEFLL
jgi:hypothetical protein